MGLSERIDQWAAQPGHNMSRLSEATGISGSLLAKYVQRKVTPSPRNLERLAPVLEVAYTELLQEFGYLPEARAAKRDEKVSYELLRRLERMQALLDAGYPKATLLAVLDANIQMAETIAVPASKPVGVPASNPSGGGLEPGVERDPMTLRCLERDLVAA